MIATELLLGKHYCEQAKADDFIDWAIANLELGIESESILILSSLSYEDDIFDVLEYFFTALNDVNYEIKKDQSYYIDKYLVYFAQKVLSNDISLKEGFQEMFDIYSRIDYNGKYYLALFEDAKEELAYQRRNNHLLIINYKIENEEVFIKKIFKDFLESKED